MKVEDHRLILGEQADPLLVVQTVGMLSRADQLEKIDDVDHANFQLGEVSEQEVNGGQHLVSADVTARCHDNIGLLASVGAELGPGADTLGAVSDSLVHGQVLQMLLLVRHDCVDVVGGR